MVLSAIASVYAVVRVIIYVWFVVSLASIHLILPFEVSTYQPTIPERLIAKLCKQIKLNTGELFFEDASNKKP